MKITTEMNLIDWDYDGPILLAPLTPIKIEVEATRIEIEVAGDRDLDPALAPSPRSVVLEMQADDGLRVIIYAFDTDEPRVFCVDVHGDITEKS